MSGGPSPAAIPGMIDKAEQNLLLDLAEYVALTDDAVVCEFGAYFGRSTRCLADGLLKNRALDLARRRTALLHTYDLFSCKRGGPFADYVVRDAQHAGLEALLQNVEDRLDFSGVFDHHMRDLPEGLVQRHQTALSAARHGGGPIALMLVDAPKWYEEFHELLVEFGPHLREGCQIVFQDYFYHWSASLVAGIQLYIEAGLFEPLESAASSLLVKTRAPIAPSVVSDLDRQFKAASIDTLIERATGRFANFELDRREAFYPRLLLAGMQHAYEAGNLVRSAVWLQQLAKLYGGKLPPSAIDDLTELVSYGFSMRRLYELDTGAATTESV